MAKRKRQNEDDQIQAMSALQEHLEMVSLENRVRIADYLASLHLREFDDLTDTCTYLAAEIARGTISPEIARAIQGLLELAFTSLAARSKGQQGQTTNTILQQLADAAREATKPKILPHYTVIEQQEEPERILIESASRAG